MALGILTALLATVGYEALQLPAAPILGALVPLLASLGVFYIVFPKFWRYYAIAVGIVAIAVARSGDGFPSSGWTCVVNYAHIRRGAPALFILLSIGALLRRGGAGHHHRGETSAIA